MIIASDSRDGRIRTGDLLLPKQAEWPGFPTSRVTSFTDKCPAGVEPDVRHGKAVGYRYIMGTITVAELSRSREHRVGHEPTSPPYECGVFAEKRAVFVPQGEHSPALSKRDGAGGI